jgi:hypothetical protein
MKEKMMVFNFKIDEEISPDREEKNLVIIGTPKKFEDSSKNGYLWFNKGVFYIPMNSCYIDLAKSSKDYFKVIDSTYDEESILVKTHNKAEITLEMPVEFED